LSPMGIHAARMHRVAVDTDAAVGHPGGSTYRSRKVLVKIFVDDIVIGAQLRVDAVKPKVLVSS